MLGNLLRKIFVWNAEDLTKVVFFATHPIDEIWIRSATFEAKKRALPVRLCIIGDLDEAIERDYAERDIPIDAISADLKQLNLEADIVVTASSGVSRQIYPITAKYLVHMPHSLASLHMIYPEDAFDGYDILFSAGPHHTLEYRAICDVRGLDSRETHMVGYGKLDQFRSESSSKLKKSDRLHVLLAPSWGPQDLLSLMGCDLVSALSDRGYTVTVRPHPILYIEKPDLINELEAIINRHELATLEEPVQKNDAMLSADVLITDYSGTAFEFAALKRSPSIFVDVTPKQVNDNWRNYGLQPVELALRDKLGVVVPPDLNAVLEGVEAIRSQERVSKSTIDQFLFDDGRSCGERVVDVLQELLGEA